MGVGEWAARIGLSPSELYKNYMVCDWFSSLQNFLNFPSQNNSVAFYLAKLQPDGIIIATVLIIDVTSKLILLNCVFRDFELS